MSAGKISVGANIGSTPRLVYFLQMRPFSRLPLIDQKILHRHFRMIHLGLQPQIPELPCQLLQPPLLLVLPPAGFEKRRVRPRDRLNITYLTCIEPHVRPGQSECPLCFPCKKKILRWSEKCHWLWKRRVRPRDRLNITYLAHKWSLLFGFTAPRA